MTFTIGHRAVWFIRATSIAIAVIIAMVIPHWAAITFGVAFGAAMWQLASYTRRRFRTTVTETTIHLHYGIFWTCETVVPLSAIRSIEQWTPPLGRLFDGSMVILRFAGGNVCLPFLSAQTAAALIDQLQQREK